MGLAKVQRLPGLPSSRVGLECLMGRDETIDFEDFLGLPQDSEQEPVDQRFLLEQRHNLLPNVGRCAPNANLGVSRGFSQPRNQAMVKDLWDGTFWQKKHDGRLRCSRLWRGRAPPAHPAFELAGSPLCLLLALCAR